MKTKEQLINNLAEIGKNYLKKYPKKTRGLFWIFPHTNQHIAEKLQRLQSSHSLIGDENKDPLLNQIQGIIDLFKKEGTLLKSILQAVINSGIYPFVAENIKSLTAKKEADQRTDDGGGYNTKWSLDDYKHVFQKPTQTPWFNSTFSFCNDCL